MRYQNRQPEEYDPDEGDAGEEPSNRRVGSRTLTLILGLALACVTVAIGWVCWTCVDSLQNKTGKLKDFNVTADNTKINSQHLDIIKNDLDTKVSMADLAPSEDLQAVLVKQEGLELVYSQATKAFDTKQFALALGLYTKVLDMLPEEAKRKSTWYASGSAVSRARLSMWAYRQRSYCYTRLKNYPRAIEEITKSINTIPDVGLNYKLRSDLYYRTGQKALGDADKAAARKWTSHYRGAGRAARKHHLMGSISTLRPDKERDLVSVLAC